MRSPSPEAKRQKTDADGAESMSIEETNAMRAKLGLAPLEVIVDTELERSAFWTFYGQRQSK